MKPRGLILNGHFDPLTSCETVDAVFDALHAGQRGWLCTVNVATLMTMRKNRTLQSFVDAFQPTDDNCVLIRIEVERCPR